MDERMRQRIREALRAGGDDLAVQTAVVEVARHEPRLYSLIPVVSTDSAETACSDGRSLIVQLEGIGDKRLLVRIALASARHVAGFWSAYGPSSETASLERCLTAAEEWTACPCDRHEELADAASAAQAHRLITGRLAGSGTSPRECQQVLNSGFASVCCAEAAGATRLAGVVSATVNSFVAAVTASACSNASVDSDASVWTSTGAERELRAVMRAAACRWFAEAYSNSFGWRPADPT